MTTHRLDRGLVSAMLLACGSATLSTLFFPVTHVWKMPLPGLFFGLAAVIVFRKNPDLRYADFAALVALSALGFLAAFLLFLAGLDRFPPGTSDGLAVGLSLMLAGAVGGAILSPALLRPFKLRVVQVFVAAGVAALLSLSGLYTVLVGEPSKTSLFPLFLTWQVGMMLFFKTLAARPRRTRLENTT